MGCIPLRDVGPAARVTPGWGQWHLGVPGHPKHAACHWALSARRDRSPLVHLHRLDGPRHHHSCVPPSCHHRGHMHKLTIPSWLVGVFLVSPGSTVCPDKSAVPMFSPETPTPTPGLQ